MLPADAFPASLTSSRNLQLVDKFALKSLLLEAYDKSLLRLKLAAKPHPHPEQLHLLHDDVDSSVS